jgi:hypothetical protein
LAASWNTRGIAGCPTGTHFEANSQASQLLLSATFLGQDPAGCWPRCRLSRVATLMPRRPAARSRCPLEPARQPSRRIVRSDRDQPRTGARVPSSSTRRYDRREIVPRTCSNRRRPVTLRDQHPRQAGNHLLVRVELVRIVVVPCRGAARTVRGRLVRDRRLVDGACRCGVGSRAQRIVRRRGNGGPRISSHDRCRSATETQLGIIKISLRPNPSAAFLREEPRPRLRLTSRTLVRKAAAGYCLGT